MFNCGDVSVEVKIPDVLKDDPIFSVFASSGQKAQRHFKLHISEDGPSAFQLRLDKADPERRLSRGALIQRVLVLLRQIFEQNHAAILSCSAVAWKDRAALCFGHGKSMLAAWAIENGFAYVADETVALGDVTHGFAAPLKISESGAQFLSEFADVGSAPMAKMADHFFISPKPEWQASAALTPGLLIFLNHKADGVLTIEKVRADDACTLMQQHLMRGDNANEILGGLSQTTPAIKLSYSSFTQLDGVLDHLMHLTLSQALTPIALDKFVGAMPRRFATAPSDIPLRSERVLPCKLSIGMATFDDYDGVYFSLQSMRLYHAEILDSVEFIIIDNNPTGPCGPDLKKLELSVPNLRYIPEENIIGTTIKDRVFKEAAGEFVLCMDSHVMFPPGVLQKLLDYFDQNPNTKNLLQGPLLYDGLKETATNWALDHWSQGMLGKWHSDERGTLPTSSPFEIEAQGMGVFACRKDAWPGFNPLFRGFGGEEVYIHGKFRQLGHMALCLPFLRWVHRFGRPMGVPYPNSWDDRIRNGLIGYDELGWDSSALVAHFQELLGPEVANRIIKDVCDEFGWSIESKLRSTTS